MEGDRSEAPFEALASISSELMGDTGVTVSQEQFDSENVTHAMITADGTTVPITLNPETGQFITPDGQTVQVQMASDETAFNDENETVLPDSQEHDFDSTPSGSFQVINSDVNVEKPETHAPSVVIKQESVAMESPSLPSNVQLLQGDGGAVVSYILSLKIKTIWDENTVIYINLNRGAKVGTIY